MRTIKVNKELPFEGSFTLTPGVYIFSESLAEDIKSIGNSIESGVVTDYEIMFEFVYRPYDSRPLDGKKLFLWRTGGAGDLIFMTPVARYLKRQYPTCQIKLACDPRYVDIFRKHPYFDEIVPYPVKLEYLEESDFHLCFESLVEFNPDAKRRNAIDLFMEQFGLRAVAGSERVPVLEVTKRSMEVSDKLWKKGKIEPKDLVVGIQFRVDAPVRQYPSVLLIEVARTLVDHHNAKIIWLGSKHHVSDIHVHGIEKYSLQKNAINLPRYLPEWQDSIAAIAKCDVVISADSASLHLAGAYKVFPEYESEYKYWHTTPMVGLYGPFLAEQRLKYYRNTVGLTARVACSGCNQHGYEPCRLGWPSPCFRVLQPQTITTALVRLLCQMPKRLEGKDLPAIDAYKITKEEWEKVSKAELEAIMGQCPVLRSPLEFAL